MEHVGGQEGETWARFVDRFYAEGWKRGLSVKDPHFAWWIAKMLNEAIEFGLALELDNE